MKILHIIFSMLTGGSETMLVDIVNEQARLGHEVELLIINSQINEDIIKGMVPEVRVSRFNRRQGSMPLLLMARLNLFVARRHPDVIHLHSHKLPGLLRIMRGRTVFTVHDINTPMQYAGGVSMAAISDAVKYYILEQRPGAHVRTVLNGIVIENIRLHEPRNNDSEFRIVQVGRLMASKKGQDILIDALTKLLARGYRATVTFIGDGADLESLKAQATRLGIADKVIFEGARDRAYIYKRLADFDIMCHPSRYEGFGLTVAEGMAAGLPLVVPEFGGPWEVAGSGRYCRSFASGDASACADALAAVMDSYAEAAALAEKGRKYVADNFSVRRMVADYIAYYKTLSGVKNN